MQNILGDLEPKKVFHYFEEIAGIPHGSFHVDAISDYLVQFAKEHGLKHIQDEAKNVIIFKPASEGAASKESLILQGHMDMVLEKNKDVRLDLEHDPIHLRVDGDFVHADGTTLGGDDGIAVAMMLAALDDDTLAHPPLECVFTTNEEVGMLGMNALDPSALKGRRMLNMDSEAEGVLTIGCAGGAEEHFLLPVEMTPRYGMSVHIVISGLKGGHSGECIHLGRANADLLMGRLLERIWKKASFGISMLEGGTKDNAIPRECTAELVLDAGSDDKSVRKAIEKFTKQVKNEYRATDPDITVSCEWTDHTNLAVDCASRKDTKKIIAFLLLLPNGLFEHVPDAAELEPQTSSNLGILKLDTDGLEAVCLVRSSIDSQKKYVQRKMKTLADLLDAEEHVEGAYPAWEPAAKSDFRDLLVQIYEEQYGKKPAIAVIHGGLECGLLADKIKGLDCVSIGPDMIGIHTPDEKLSIRSTQRTWEFVKTVLAKLAMEANYK